MKTLPTDTAENTGELSREIPLIVQLLAAQIPISEDFDKDLPEPLRAPLRGITLCNHYRDRMLLGRKGLPDTSAKLVQMGVFYIEGGDVVLHPALCAAFELKKEKRDRLLDRLRALQPNPSEEDLKALLAD